VLQNLYTQASDAHLTLVVESKTPKWDNDNLCEQVTTDVAQAHIFWTTQDDKLLRKKEQDLKEKEATMEDDLIWVCP
jgi:hypothetical protein